MDAFVLYMCMYSICPAPNTCTWCARADSVGVLALTKSCQGKPNRHHTNISFHRPLRSPQATVGFLKKSISVRGGGCGPDAATATAGGAVSRVAAGATLPSEPADVKLTAFDGSNTVGGSATPAAVFPSTALGCCPVAAAAGAAVAAAAAAAAAFQSGSPGCAASGAGREPSQLLCVGNSYIRMFRDAHAHRISACAPHLPGSTQPRSGSPLVSARSVQPAPRRPRRELTVPPPPPPPQQRCRRRHRLRLQRPHRRWPRHHRPHRRHR
eukprot:SAG22_NODE_1520_length_4237_cov_11.486225_1_plen_267_part_10